MTWFRRIAIVAAVLGATVLLTRALYSTEVGGWIQRLVPTSVWNLLYATLELEGAETTANADLVVWLLACFIVCGAVAWGSRILFRRFFARS